MHLNIFLYFCFLLQRSSSAQGNQSLLNTTSKQVIIKLNLFEIKHSKFQISDFLKYQDDSNYSLLSASNDSVTSDGDQNESHAAPKRNFNLVITFCAIALLIVLINLRVFKVVTTEAQQTNRSVNFFVAHLSFLAIGFTCVVFIYVMEKSNIFSLTAPGLCEILSFLRNAILSLFPLNSMAITYVRIRCSTSNMSNASLSLALFLIWIVATVGSLPSIFMVKYTKDSSTQLEKCKQIPLLGTFEATLAYEIFRFVVYHFLVCFYMTYDMIQIRARIRYLYVLKPIPNKMKRRVQRVRFVYIHSIVFILIWLPTGLGLGLYKLRTRIEWMADYINLYITAMVALCSSLFILSPLVYVLIHEETSTVICKGLGITGSNCMRNRIGKNVNTNVQMEISCQNNFMVQTKSESGQYNKCKRKFKRNVLHELTNDMSRISTAPLSEKSDRSIKSYRNVNFQSLGQGSSRSQTCAVQSYVVGKQNIDVNQESCKQVKETLV